MAIRKFETSVEELLTILAEECAELIQEIMKMKRKNNYSSSKFTDEAADVLLMFNLCREKDLLNEEDIQARFKVKREKLKQWSRLL